jgi:O-antigen/teichoic acid export membrane protein
VRTANGSVFKPAVLLAGGRGIALAVTFLIPVIFARIFAPAQFGTYKQIFLIHATIYALGLGLADALFYFLPAEPERAGRYVANCVAMLSGLGITSFVILTAVGGYLTRWFNNPMLSGLGPLIGCYLALTLASAPLEIVMIARGRNRLAAAAYAFSDLIRGVFVLIPVIVWPRLDVLVAGSIAFAIVRIAGTVVFFRREFAPQLWPDSDCLRKQLRYTIPLQAAIALQVLQSNLHQYVISLRFDAAQFAQYAVGCMNIPVFDLIAGSVLSVMMIQMGERLARGRVERVLQIWSDATRKLALVFFPILVLLWIESPDFITLLFTDRYLPSVTVFRMWLLSFFFFTLQPHGVLRVYADTRFLALQNLLKVVILAISIGPMISTFGLSGAVSSSVFAVLVGKCMLVLRMKHIMRVSLSSVLPWRTLAGISGLSLMAAAPAVALGYIVQYGAAVRLFSVGGIYATVYGATIWLFVLRSGHRPLLEKKNAATLWQT